MARSIALAIIIVAVTLDVVSIDGPAPAGAQSVINACVSKTGAIRIITSGSCKSGETPLNWNTQGAQGNGALIVKDSVGAVVGTLVGLGIVAPTVAGGKAVLSVSGQNGFENVSISSLIFYHTTADCSGPRYMESINLPRLGHVVNGVAYLATGSTQVLEILSQEIFVSDQTDPSQPGDCVSFPGAESIAVATFITVPVSQLGTPPFSVQ